MTDLAAPLSRRQFLRTAGLAAAGIALAGCQPAVLPSAKSPDARVQLVYRDWNTEWFPPMAQRMLEQFHASHPNVRVYYNLDPESDVFDEKSLADLQAGSAADVFQGCCSSFPVWAQKGYLLDLRPYVQADLDRGTIDDWDPVQYKALFSRDGRQFGLPKYHGALALYYNKDIFDRYGVDYPTAAWNHNDYLSAMKRLTRDTNGDGRTDLWGSMLDVGWERLQVHVNGWGGHFVDPGDDRRSQMSDPPSLAALEWIHERMWTDKVMATSMDTQVQGPREAFVSQKLAMVEEGSWALKDILSSAKFRIGVAPFPAGPARRATLATTDGFGIYAGTKYPEAAWELLKFLVSKEYGRAMAQAHFLQPARASLVDEWVACVRDEFPSQTKEMDLSAFADGQLRGYSVTAETFANQAAANQIANAAWQRIFILGQASTDTILSVSHEIEATQTETR